MNKPSLLNIIDRGILFFTLLFVVTLTNSIFLNQVGYYGALLLLLMKFAVSGENPFSKTGLEIAFVLFIIAELFSSVFSDNQARAFFYMTKRVLLLPVVYTMIASVTDLSRGRKYLYFYLAGALASVLIYLFFSYRHLILNLYNIQQSGPSIFQYPITASEIMSFTVIILFAFLINEKTKLRNRIFIFIGFALSAAALFSTYKRTGWIGTAAGIIVILIMKKQWKILAAGLAAIIIIFFLQENVSRGGIYSIENNKVKLETDFETEGRAYNILAEDDNFYISDFQNGISSYNNSGKISGFNTPAPVVSLYHWKDNYYAALLLDTRFLLLKKNGKFLYGGEFITPGFTTFTASANDYFYVLDSDSGLTLFLDPENLDQKKSFKEFRGCTRMFADSNYIVAASGDSIYVAELINGIPERITYRDAMPQGYNLVYYAEGKGLLSGISSTFLFAIDKKRITILDESKELSSIYLSSSDDGRFFLVDSPGNIYEIEYPLGNKISLIFKDRLNLSPRSISVNKDRLYFSYVKESRILSIFDLYNPSNFTRLALWRAGWEMFLDNPLFGVGDIDLQEQYIKYKRPYDKEIQGHLHNNFIHILATLGIFGFIVVCYLLFRILIINIRIFNNLKESPFYSSYALGVTGAFCSVIAAGLTEVNIWDHEILTLVMFTLGLNIAFYKNYKKNLKQV
jgi:hypothetical protein